MESENRIETFEELEQKLVLMGKENGYLTYKQLTEAFQIYAINENNLKHLFKIFDDNNIKILEETNTPNQEKVVEILETSKRRKNIEINEEILLKIIENSKSIMKYKDLMKSYNQMLLTNRIKLKQLSASNFGRINNILKQKKNILIENNMSYRFYPIDTLTKDKIDCLKNIIKNEGIFSTKFIFKKNESLMKKIDIRNEYELYDLLKKTIGSLNGKIIYCPDLEIMVGFHDRRTFIRELIYSFSPITLKNLAKYINQEYGLNTTKISNDIQLYFSMCIHKGIISVKHPDLNETQLNKLKKELTNDIYSIDTLKEKCEAIGEEIFNQLGTRNMAKLNYCLAGSYILSHKYDNLKEYVDKKVFENDYYYIDSEVEKIGKPIFMYIKQHINDLHIFRIAEDKYITIKKLNEMGISEKDILNMINSLTEQLPENTYFNLYTLKRNSMLKEFNNEKLNDQFYESVISQIPGVKIVGDEKNKVFIISKKKPSLNDFINEYANEHNMGINEVIKEINETFNININNDML